MFDVPGELLQKVAADARSMTALELTGTLFGAAYLLLAIRESIWCWLCAFVASCIFAFLFFSSFIYMDAALQLFYAGMAVYGWWSWRGGREQGAALSVVRWPFFVHAVAAVLIVVASLISGYMLQTWTQAEYPYVDSVTTFASLWATWLVARKVLENWWYWLLIDAVSIAIYIERGLEFVALLFLIYVIMIPFGLIAWSHSFRERAGAATA